MQKQVNNLNRAHPFTMPVHQELRILGAANLQVEELVRQRFSNTKIPYSPQHRTNRLPASSTRARDTKSLRWRRNLVSWLTSKRSITRKICKAKEIYLKTSSFLRISRINTSRISQMRNLREPELKNNLRQSKTRKIIPQRRMISPRYPKIKTRCQSSWLWLFKRESAMSKIIPEKSMKTFWGTMKVSILDKVE